MKPLGFIVLSLVCLGCQSRQTPAKPDPSPAKESSRSADDNAKRNSPDNRFAFANVMRLHAGQTYAQTVEVMGEPDLVQIPSTTTDVDVYWFTGHGSIGYKSLGVSEREVCVTFVNGVVARVILRQIESPTPPKKK